MLFWSFGTLRYSTVESRYKLIVEVDDDLGNYYRTLIPKWYNVKRGRYSTHITVVRCYKEVPTNLESWGRHEGEEIEFFYSPFIQIGKVYSWLNVFCKRLEDVRKELGLSISSEYTRPPEGFLKCFHLTLGNSKL